MTSFTSNSSFGGRSSFSEGSDLSTSPNFSRMPKFDEMRRDGPMQAIEDEGALTHPVLSSFNRDVVVAGEFGLAKMQVRRPRTGWLTRFANGTDARDPPPPLPITDSAPQTKAEWEKQMAAFDKEDAKKVRLCAFIRSIIFLPDPARRCLLSDPRLSPGQEGCPQGQAR